MEILRSLRWAMVAGKGGRSTPWLLPAAAGFCAVFFAVALCVKSAVVRRHGEVKGSNSGDRGWSAVKNKVMSAVRNGGVLRRLRDEDGQVSFLREAEEGGGRISTTTPPPLWQKKIIMGEKCELPTFSGLILYDENGNALPHARKTAYR